MKKNIFSKILILSISLGLGVVPVYAEGETVPAKESQPRIMPAYSEKSAATSKAVVENKQAVTDVIINPETRQSDVPDEPAIGLPGPIAPPTIDWSKINFPPIEYGYVNKDGYQVKIKSDKEVLTVSWEKVSQVDVKSNASEVSSAPTLSSSKSFSLNVKTGSITETTCFTLCKTKELNPKENTREYIAALKAMSEKVAEGIKDPKPRPGVIDFKLRQINRVLNYLIQVIGKHLPIGPITL